MNLEVSRTNTVSTREVHTATVKVGKDTIEAEYLTFDHSNWWNTKKKNVLENIWDAITTPYYKVKNWTRDTYWMVRYGFQRMFKGYDCVDVFDTFDKFVERYSKIIKELRNNHWGYPYDLTEEKWDEVLDEMLYHLHYMDEETVVEALERDVPDDWSASYKTVHYILDKHKDAFFELFSKYFYHLWD